MISDLNVSTLEVLDSALYKRAIQRGKGRYNEKNDHFSDNDSAFLIIGSEVQPGSINMGILYSNESISVIVRK